MRKTLSFVIITHGRRPRMLRRCLESLEDAAAPDAQTCVVFNTFNSTIRSDPSLHTTTDEQGVFTMDVIGGDETDNNFDLYYLVCGDNAYWINSLATEDCYQKLGAGAVCPIRCATPGGWCSFAAD